MKKIILILLILIVSVVDAFAGAGGCCTGNPPASTSLVIYSSTYELFQFKSYAYDAAIAAYNSYDSASTPALTQCTSCPCPDTYVAGYYLVIERWGNQFIGPDYHDYKCYHYFEYDRCYDPPEEEFCIIAGYSCPDGTPAGMEYVTCVDGVPSGGTSFCGNSAIMAAMSAGTIDGTITMPPCNCTERIDTIDARCQLIYAANADCGDDCFTDSDGDGVADCFDACPDTPAGVAVNDLGCDPSGDDDDGDGIPDEADLCPDTPANVQVDIYGCQLDDPQKDSDGDGVDDSDDICPNTPPGYLVDINGCITSNDPDTDGDGVPDSDDNCSGTSPGVPVDANGCEIITPDPDPNVEGGDQDNDVPTLNGIISWLKNIVGINRDIESNTDQIAKNTDGIEPALDDVNKSLNDVNASLNDIIDGMDPGSYTDNPDARIKDDSGMTNSLNTFMSNIEENPATSFLKNTTANFSGSPILTIDIAGQSVVTDFTRWQSEFQAAGTALLMIVTFMCGLYIFRG